MNNNQCLINDCLDDRNDALADLRLNWYKRNGFDLTLKFFILLYNSLGLCNCKDNSFIFVDEIKNSSMSNNLMDTQKQFDAAGKKTLEMHFFNVQRRNHIHIGFFSGTLLGMTVLFSIIPIIIFSLFSKNVLKQNMYILIWAFNQYLKYFEDRKVMYVMMTDHHFYSSIIGHIYEKNSIVLQHGLIYRPEYFEPRAGHILVWGKNSLDKLKNKNKAIISGTFKYSKILESNYSNKIIKRIMFCINSKDHEIVKQKIRVIYLVANELGMRLLVKCHPGSIYNDNDVIQEFRETEIEFEKEKLIKDLDFDIAVMEDSTAILDVLLLKKPFIFYDKDGKYPYFTLYGNLLPRAETAEQMVNLIKNHKDIDYETIIDRLLDLEVNGNRCTIIEDASLIMKEVYGVE